MNESDGPARIGPNVAEAARGQAYPSEFMEWVGDVALEAVTDWLRAHQAPDVVVQLVGDLVWLEDMRRRDPDKDHSLGRAGYNVELMEGVSHMIWGVNFLGGSYPGRGSVYQGKDVTDWGKE